MYAVFLAWAALWQGASWYAETAAVGLTLVTLAHVFFVTENETLSRRVQRQVPRSAGLALLVTPFFPGGGRAILLFGVHVLMAVLFGLLAEAYRTGTAVGPPAWWFERGFAFLVFSGYLFVYLAGISLPFSRRTYEVRMRWIARVAVPLVALITIFAPSIVDSSSRSTLRRDPASVESVHGARAQHERGHVEPDLRRARAASSSSWASRTSRASITPGAKSRGRAGDNREEGPGVSRWSRAARSASTRSC